VWLPQVRTKWHGVASRARSGNAVSLRACFRAVALVRVVGIPTGAADAAARDIVPLAYKLGVGERGAHVWGGFRHELQVAPRIRRRHQIV
jgi:hypothetical protein